MYIGGLPFPAGLTTSIGSYNMLGNRPAPRTAGGSDRLATMLQGYLLWFKQRPALALVSFIGLLLFGSVLLPFLILSHWNTASSLRAGGEIASGAASQSRLLTLTNSRGMHSPDVFRKQLQDTQRALGLLGGMQEEIQKLQEHGHEYAGQHGGGGAGAGAAARSGVSDAGDDAGVSEAVALPGGSSLPSLHADIPAQPDRAAAVIAAFKHSYGAYEKRCMGQDEYHPLSHRCSDWIGAGLTIIDALR